MISEQPSDLSLDFANEAVAAERKRCADVVRQLLAVYKVGMAGGVLQQALKGIEEPKEGK